MAKLRKMTDAGVKRFVYAASSSTYGDSESLPKVEEVIGKPLSPYAITKYVNELYADVFAKNYGIEYIGLRYFNVFGPRQSQDDEYAVVIPKFINCLLKGENPPIFGDGTQSRDFTYIDDIVEAVNAAVTNDIQGPVNLGWGRPTNFNQLAELVCKPVGYKPELFHHLEAPIGVYYRVSDPNKMLSFYTPKITLEEGIDRAIKNLNNS